MIEKKSIECYNKIARYKHMKKLKIGFKKHKDKLMKKIKKIKTEHVYLHLLVYFQ